MSEQTKIDLSYKHLRQLCCKVLNQADFHPTLNQEKKKVANELLSMCKLASIIEPINQNDKSLFLCKLAFIILEHKHPLSMNMHRSMMYYFAGA